MIKQLAVVCLSLIPFAVSTAFALGAWELLEALSGLWRLVTVVLVWIATFAAGTQAFWMAVEALSPA
jgi:hypothetical protein